MTTDSVMITSIIVGAGLVRGSLGFGDALFAMPLLAFFIPATTAAPLVAMTAMLIAAVILVRDWRHVVLRPATLLIVFGLLAVPFGVLLLKSGDDRFVKGLLATVVLLFSGWSLWRPGLFQLYNDRLAPVFGLAAGLLGGACNTAGPPLVIFGTLRRWSPQQFRATLQTYCLIASLWVIVMHCLTGLMTRAILNQFLVSGPLIVISTFIGLRITSRIPTERFIRIVHGVLIVVGLSLLVASLSPDASANDQRTDGVIESVSAP